MSGFDALVRSLCPPFAFAGIGVARGESAATCYMATAPGIAAGPETMFRVASISKVVTGQTLHRVAEGQDPPYAGRDISEVLGFPIRNSAHPEVPITLGHLLSHSASLTDAAGYAIPPGQSLQDWLAATGPACFGPQTPGKAAEYCNLSYILVAAAAEALGGDSFDRLARQLVLDRLGIAGGFNWSGVDAAHRADWLTTYRRDGTRLVPQIDAALPETAENDTDRIPTAERRLGHVARFSPQGGLRTSLAGCLTLARALKSMDATPLWQGPPSPDGVFESYGAGIQIFDYPPFYPRPLIGHFANAYGFCGGIWYDRATDTAFAYGLNGLPLGDESDELRPEELSIFNAVAES